MSFFIVRNDITRMYTDAIVNAANNSLLGGDGVDGAIHRAAGPELLEECKALGGCKTGEAKITKGYNLPAKYIIHTVGPVWRGGQYGEEKLLISCYTESLSLAVRNHCSSIAFPLISAGAYGYPTEDAVRVATDTIRDFLQKEDMDVYLVVFDQESLTASKRLFDDVREYIGNHYVWTNFRPLARNREVFPYEDIHACKAHRSLDETLKHPDESFSQMLFRLIARKGMTDVECYKKANIDRKVFSRIRNGVEYHPSKTTAVAFAFALELSFQEAKRLIEAAGYSLTRNNKFDLIVEYFLVHGKYDIIEINEVLFEFEQKLLGC